jgi:hypothetical protein
LRSWIGPTGARADLVTPAPIAALAATCSWSCDGRIFAGLS